MPQHLAAVFIALAALQASAQEIPQIPSGVVVGDALVIIGPDGVANVTLYMNSTIGPTAALVDLPVEPLAGYLRVIAGKADGTIYLGEGFAVILFNASPAYAVIQYSSLPNMSGGFLLYIIRSPSWAFQLTVKIHRSFLVHTLPDSLIDYGEDGDYYYYTLAPGYVWDLMLSPGRGASTGQPPNPTEPAGTDLWGSIAYIGIPMAGTLAALAVTILRLRRSRREGQDLLDSVDKEILEILRRSGESAFTSDIASATRLPKTTLWRRLRKLEKLGYVEISRAGRQSVVRLKRPRRS